MSEAQTLAFSYKGLPIILLGDQIVLSPNHRMYFSSVLSSLQYLIDQVPRFSLPKKDKITLIQIL